MMMEEFAYVGRKLDNSGVQVLLHIPIGGRLLIDHPRHARQPLDSFEWGTLNNRSYFLAQAILQDRIGSRPHLITKKMIETFQVDVIATQDPDRMELEVDHVNHWIENYLAQNT